MLPLKPIRFNSGICNQLLFEPTLFLAFFTCEQRARVFDLYRQLCTVGRQKIANLRGEHADVVCTSANLEIVNSASKKWKSEERYEVCRKHCAYNFPVSAICH